MNIDQINSYWVLVSGVIGGVGVAYLWVRLFKTNLIKDVSENKKMTKVNDVEGDEAIVKQIDFLLNQISLMSESMLKDKIELSNTKTKEIKYKDAIERIKNTCNACKVNIEKVLTDLNLE